MEKVHSCQTVCPRPIVRGFTVIPVTQCCRVMIKVKDCDEDDKVSVACTATKSDAEDSRKGSATAASVCNEEENGGTRRKKKKRRKTRKKQHLQLQQLPPLDVSGDGPQAHTVLNLPSSSDEVEAVGECSKRDSSSSLGGASRHNTLRESLLTVLGKLVIWKGTRYRSATAASSSSSAPPNSPPATECIGRSTSFFSSGEFLPFDSEILFKLSVKRK